MSGPSGDGSAARGKVGDAELVRGRPKRCPACRHRYTTLFVFPSGDWVVCVNPRCDLWGGPGAPGMSVGMIGSMDPGDSHDAP